MSRPLSWTPDSPLIPPAERQYDKELAKGLAFDGLQYVDVTFGAADTDLDIRHTLNPTSFEDVGYLVVKADRATSIYNDQTGTRRPWGQGYIILRSSVADATVTLLLFKPHR